MHWENIRLGKGFDKCVMHACMQRKNYIHSRAGQGRQGQHVLEVVSALPLHLHMTSHELIQTTQAINATRLEP